MEFLKARLPDRRSIIGVYATAVFLVYGWTLLASFWKVPSWLYFLKISDILSVYAYAFVVDFAESLILLFIVLLIGAILPRRWWNSHFIATGIVWIAVPMGSIMLRLYTNRTPDMWEDFVYNQWAWWGYTLLLGLLLSFLFSRVGWLRKALEGVSDRLTVFLYIYLPVTFLSVILIIGRIVF
jgi:hypothetical protein